MLRGAKPSEVEYSLSRYVEQGRGQSSTTHHVFSGELP